MKIWDAIKNGFNEHSPEIFAGLSIASWTAAVVSAIIETPKAKDDIEAKKKELSVDELSIIDTAKACWKRYLVTALSAAAGAGFEIASVSEGNKKYTTVLAANELLATNVREYINYRKNTEEQLGQKKEQEIYQQTQAQQVQENPPTPKNTLTRDPFVQGNPGGPICYFPDFGIYIYASYDEVKAALNKAGERILGSIGGTSCFNDLLDDLRAESFTYGDYLGWNLETGVPTIPDKEDITYAGTPVTGDPCWVCRFNNPPQYEYQFFRR